MLKIVKDSPQKSDLAHTWAAFDEAQSKQDLLSCLKYQKFLIFNRKPSSSVPHSLAHFVRSISLHHSSVAARLILSLALILTGCREQANTADRAPSASGTHDQVQAQGEASDSGKAALPPAPESQILDDGHVFALVPDELAKLAKFLKDLHQNNGIQIYVAMYGFLDGETVEERAHRLRKAWANHNTGVVVVYESGSGGLSFVATDEIDVMLTEHDINVILQSAGTAAQNEEGSENQILAAVHTLADSLVSKLDRRKQANALTAQKRFMVVASTIACIVLLTLIGMLVARWVNRNDRRASEFYYFPSARVGTRFGAMFSGGTGAEIRFK
ncbi:MAG: putative membrane protein YgcG [Verrucomicrobiales bacterium]